MSVGELHKEVRHERAVVNRTPGSFGRPLDGFIAKLTDDSLAGAPANDGISTPSDDDSGGGSIDALLAILLAQFALARALRQRSRPRQ